MLVPLLLAGCAAKRGGPIPYDEAGSFQPPDEPTTATLDSGYKIAPMDTLTVNVFKMEDLSGEYQVDLTGNISLPLIGEVQAANLSTAEPLLAPVCNDVLMVIESGKTRTHAAVEAINRLRAAGANVLGATLTKSTEEKSGYGYGYGNYRYGSIDKSRTEIVMLGHQA